MTKTAVERCYTNRHEEDRSKDSRSIRLRTLKTRCTNPEQEKGSKKNGKTRIRGFAKKTKFQKSEITMKEGGWVQALSHPGTRPPVLWTGRMQVWTGIPVQQLVVDW